MTKSNVFQFGKVVFAALAIPYGAYSIMTFLSGWSFGHGYFNHSLFIQHAPVLLFLTLCVLLYRRFVAPLEIGILRGIGAHWFALAVFAIYLADWIYGRISGVPAEQFVVTIFDKPATGIVTTALTIFLLAPVNEEIVFRGVMLNVFRSSRQWTLWLGTLLTSLLFMKIHAQYGNVDTNIELFAFALVMCAARIRSGGLLLPVLLHSEAAVFALLFAR
ncbi:CPBP family intramembrane metalloprotease [Kosakonia sacchari]|uniref:CPBP family intramembrane glutamic endopeptidase n=1 Tax=Kosakonia sacchari TaxID=1158459 RepID=UPI002ACEFE51|nr:CPBP family intramembrane glutamic endopeptidase [Kosakonia sacchari]MDZ7324950.1 CPBP family intramembrane metalloprotease [Kosakonia sacchari]